MEQSNIIYFFNFPSNNFTLQNYVRDVIKNLSFSTLSFSDLTVFCDNLKLSLAVSPLRRSYNLPNGLTIEGGILIRWSKSPIRIFGGDLVTQRLICFHTIIEYNGLFEGSRYLHLEFMVINPNF
jgi:hypothetical protein